MRRPDKTGGKSAKTQRLKTAARKRGNAPKVARHRGSSADDLSKKVALFKRERDEALEQQRATSEVLRVISSSPGDLKPVFDAILANAIRICEATFGNLFLREGPIFRTVAVQSQKSHADILRRSPEIDLRDNPGIPLDRIATTKKVVHIPDLRTDQSYIGKNDLIIPLVEVVSIRTYVAVPMLKEGDLIGSINMYRQEVRPFSDKQIELVQNFAAQAVIAIENTRLLNELRESLQRQTATAEVLKVISSSQGDLKPVFEAMLANATRICEATFGTLALVEGNAFRRVALHNAPPEYIEAHKADPIIPRSAETLYRLFKTMEVVHVADLSAESPDEGIIRLGGARTVLVVPMLKENELIGGITIYREEVRPFTDKQIELLKNFAAQAVIAIENTRLLSELRESLQQQTATADVLKVISRSTFDLKSVLSTLLESAARLCEADIGNIARPTEGGAFQVEANYGQSTALWDEMSRLTLKAGKGSVIGRTALSRATVHILDAQTDPDYELHEAQRLGGYHTMLGVPLLREGNLVGVFGLARRTVRPFTEKQIELVTTFADQAVIAIENVRLFDEVQARTGELSEALEQQTATSEVLKVISRSPGDLQPVFDAILANATDLCSAKFASLRLSEGNGFRTVSLYNAPAALVEHWRSTPLVRPHPESSLGRTAVTKQVVQIDDVRKSPAYSEGDPLVVAGADLGGYRTVLAVPMLREDALVGVISIYHQEVRPFTDKQIELVKNFAAQAVIAIENTRLLNELRESLQQQTATADVLKVISRSTFDLRTVLQTLVESAARLCDANKTIITREKNGVFYRAEAYGFSREFIDYVKDIPIKPERGSSFGRALLEGRVVHIPDVNTDPEYTFFDHSKLGDYHTILSVPMLRESVSIGVVTLCRSEVRPFTEKQVELATTFADQAAIAIENVRLFERVEARTRELAKSLEDLRTTQDRLVQTQKLASLGQLTAGIAHEIKNPLNFVNNFSGLSAELIDELQQSLKDVSLNDIKRDEIAELMETLRGNLDKVAQHGKRADAIVKNMLLHSREGSGEHRVVDINDVVEGSLNLAWHGARAEKKDFDVNLERSFDPTAGDVDLFPQDITRVLLNLISNGFYATTKRKAETNGGDYVPTLAASTKSLGDRVEIRIRDNGTGMSPEVKEKIFDPFFTTKPAGEGTGLGLSICHDIVVKQHAGSIEVDTRPGEFTEIRVILPRAAALLPERS